MFEAVQYVATPLAALAFVIAVAAYAYRGSVAARANSIRSAPETDRARLVEATLRDFAAVDTSDLSRKQKYDLVLQLIEERKNKFKHVANKLLAGAVLVAILIGASLFLEHGGPDPHPAAVPDPTVTTQARVSEPVAPVPRTVDPPRSAILTDTGTSAPESPSTDISGLYNLKGSNTVDGQVVSTYTGLATITSRSSGRYDIRWRIHALVPSEYTGSGTVVDDRFIIDEGKFNAEYRILSDGALEGKWFDPQGPTNLTGMERLEPAT
jgi:hypothetical protein